MNSLKIRWFLGIWLGLFFLFLPFPFHLLPEIGATLSDTTLPITHWISGISFDILEKTGNFSDSTHLFVQSLLLGILALPIGLFLAKNEKTKSYLPLLSSIIACILAFFLLKYGLEKFTRLQFPIPPANLLYTPAGQMDKDMLFWTSMGTSSAYAWFMGTVEIAAGLLLLWRKTRIIGALFAVGIFANVFAINIGFDITVKLLSFALLLSAFYLLAPYLKNIICVLTNAPVTPVASAPFPIKGRWKRIAKGSVVALIALECGIPVIEFQEASEVHSELYNTSFQMDTVYVIPNSFQTKSLRRVHFHRDGFLITESNDGIFTSHEIGMSPGSHQFKLIDSKSRVWYRKQAGLWTFYDGVTPLFRAKQLDNTKLPLLQDTFHWSVESMLPE